MDLKLYSTLSADIIQLVAIAVLSVGICGIYWRFNRSEDKTVMAIIFIVSIFNALLSRLLGVERYPIMALTILGSPLAEYFILSVVEGAGIIILYKRMVSEWPSWWGRLLCLAAALGWGFAAQRLIIEFVGPHIPFHLIGKCEVGIVWFFTVVILLLGKGFIGIIAEKEAAMKELAYRKQEELERVREELKEAEKQKNELSQIAILAKNESESERKRWQENMTGMIRHKDEEIERIRLRGQKLQKEREQAEEVGYDALVEIEKLKKHRELARKQEEEICRLENRIKDLQNKKMADLGERYRRAFPNVNMPSLVYERLIELSSAELGAFEGKLHQMLYLSPGEMSQRDIIEGTYVKHCDFLRDRRAYYYKDGNILHIPRVGDKNTYKEDINWLKSHHRR